MTADRKRRGLRVVFVCQAVDRDDPVLATTIRWLEALAGQRRVAHVRVLALRTGDHELPSTVAVREFGRGNKLATAVAFYRALARSMRPRPDVFFVYQGGPYPILLLPLKLFARIPVVQWKAHPVITRSMAFYARWCDDLIFTAARASFPMELAKRRVVGHGIDTDFFHPPERRPTGDLIATGRVAPVKRIDQMVRAVAHANRTYETDYRLDVYGATMSHNQAYVTALEDLIEQLGAHAWVTLHGPVRHEEMPALLGAHRALLNFSDTAVDKSAVEAMACGLPVISTNDSVREVMPADLRPALVVDKHDTAAQARAIHELLQSGDAAIARLGGRMRELAVSDHSVDPLFGRILSDVDTLLEARG